MGHRARATAVFWINGHEPYVYLRGVPQRLPTHPVIWMEELLPHRWTPAG
jgi:hypothetical protein